MDLRNRDLRNHNLTGAQLTGADLAGATFSKGELDYKVTAASTWLEGARQLPSGVSGEGWPYSGDTGSAPWTVDIDFRGFVVLNSVQLRNYNGGGWAAKSITLQVYTGSGWVDSQSYSFSQSKDPPAWDTANLLTNKLRFKVNSTNDGGGYPIIKKLTLFGQAL